jgi:aromatic ring-cleaving dioxygenase
MALVSSVIADAAMDKRNNAVGISLFKKAGIDATPAQLTEMVDKRIFEQLNVILGRKPEEQGPPADKPQWKKNFRSPAEGPDLYFPRDNSGYFLSKY